MRHVATAGVFPPQCAVEAREPVLRGYPRRLSAYGALLIDRQAKVIHVHMASSGLLLHLWFAPFYAGNGGAHFRFREATLYGRCTVRLNLGLRQRILPLLLIQRLVEGVVSRATACLRNGPWCKGCVRLRE